MTCAQKILKLDKSNGIVQNRTHIMLWQRVWQHPDSNPHTSRVAALPAIMKYNGSGHEEHTLLVCQVPLGCETRMRLVVLVNCQSQAGARLVDKFGT
jgi:hypothetical protein